MGRTRPGDESTHKNLEFFKPAQRISLIVVPLLAVAAVFGLMKWKHDSDFRVLYSSLSPEDASAVTQKIREAGIEYRLDETGATVLVPSAQIAEARLALAGAGLPKTGRIGFELFDRTNLGASDFAEQVNYRRALEGELERTVATLSEIEQARIHITFAKESVFLDARQPSKATVVLRSAARRSAAAAECHRDRQSGGQRGGRPLAGGGGHHRRRRTSAEPAPRRRATAKRSWPKRTSITGGRWNRNSWPKSTRALEPLLGPDRFRASVNVDCDFSSSEQSEESVDPAKSAVLTSQTTEESSGGAAAARRHARAPASNLPQSAGTRRRRRVPGHAAAD